MNQKQQQPSNGNSVNGVNNKAQSKSQQQQQQTTSKASSRHSTNSVQVTQQNKLNNPTNSSSSNNNKVNKQQSQSQQINGCVRPEVNGEIQSSKSKTNKKSGKGKENNVVTSPRMSVSEAEAFRSKALEMNGVVAHMANNTKVVRVSQENGLVHGAANAMVAARTKLQEGASSGSSGKKNSPQIVAQNGTCAQQRATMREMVAAMTGADANSQAALKKKKKKKKGQGNQGVDDWHSVGKYYLFSLDSKLFDSVVLFNILKGNELI